MYAKLWVPKTVVLMGANLLQYFSQLKLFLCHILLDVIGLGTRNGIEADVEFAVEKTLKMLRSAVG